MSYGVPPPPEPHVRVARVVRTHRVGASFVRVTLAVDEPWADLGWDQWVRAFLPRPDGSLVLPLGPATGWYTRWKELDEQARADIRNETVRAVRPLPASRGGGAEVDVDLVVHTGDDGAVAGPAGRWATTAAPGSTVGLLEQGTILDDALPVLRGDGGGRPHPDGGPLVLLSDEAGLPAVEGVARSLPAGSRAVLLLEVPDERDRRELPSAAELDVRWVVREHSPHAGRPGEVPTAGRTALGVLEQVLERRELPEHAVVAAIGETEVVGAVRRIVRAHGVPKHRVRACPYWSASLRP